MKIMPCPYCGSANGVWVSRIMCGRNPPGLWYYLECKRCHGCGETKLFEWRAIAAWNRESRKNKVHK